MDEANKNSFTPLFNASYEWRLEVVKLLCDAGATKCQARKDGLAPLLIASQEGHVDAACDAGANTDKTNNAGATPLLTASESGHADVVKLLCDADATKDAPLYIASQKGHVEVERLL